MSHYQEFIDDMVDLARRCVLVERIRRQGHAERPNWREVPLDPDEAARMALFERLTGPEREVIARLLQEVRWSAVHDVLADLEWRTSADDLKMTKDGEDFADGVNESMHGDFVGRMMGGA